MKIYETKGTEKFGEALADIINNTSQGLISDKDSHKTAFLVIEDPYGSGIKEILSVNYYKFGSRSEINRFESCGFYYKGTLYNIDEYGMVPFPILTNQERMKILNEVFEVVRVYPKEVPYRIMSFMLDNFPTLESLEKAGFKTEVAAVNQKKWDTADIQMKLISEAPEDIFFNPFKENNNVDIFTLIKNHAGDITEKQLLEKYDKPYQTWANYLAYCQTVKRVRENIPPAQQAIQDIKKFAHDNEIKEKSNITIKIDGKDSMLGYSIKTEYPSFSIEGQTVTIKQSLVSFLHNMKPEGQNILVNVYYEEKLTPVLKERYSNRNEMYLNKYYFSDIQSITYGKKILYKR